MFRRMYRLPREAYPTGNAHHFLELDHQQREEVRRICEVLAEAPSQCPPHRHLLGLNEALQDRGYLGRRATASRVAASQSRRKAGTSNDNGSRRNGYSENGTRGMCFDLMCRRVTQSKTPLSSIVSRSFEHIFHELHLTAPLS